MKTPDYNTEDLSTVRIALSERIDQLEEDLMLAQRSGRVAYAELTRGMITRARAARLKTHAALGLHPVGADLIV